jgi:ferrochelatase
MSRTAVILFNLGGPDKLDSVKPFLGNLFNDPAIIRLPRPLRRLVAGLIVGGRLKTAQEIYAKLGGRSPILANTELQARALEQQLGPEAKCFIAMRYWHPFAEEAVAAVKQFAPQRLVLLPLYPQFSTTTSASSLRNWQEAARAAGLDAPAVSICCYPTLGGFIAAMNEAVRASYEKAKNFGAPRVLFSAHGLPEKIVSGGDPYQYQCERTVSALVSALGIDNLDWALCYQSRVGPMRWIGPSTEDEIRRAGRDKVPLVIAPIAFVSENSETLYEIDMLYRDLAAAAGVPYFDRTATAGIAPAFIAGLAALVRDALACGRSGHAASGRRLCPGRYSGCGNQS